MINLLPFRNLIWTLVKRDIRTRYIGSVVGIYWSVINPLIVLLVYIVVFGVFLQGRMPGSTSIWDYALYFSSGFLPWTAFNASVTRSASSILDNKNYVKKVPFPNEIFPISTTLSELVGLLIGLVIYLVLFLILKGNPSIFLAFLPLAIFLQLLFSFGLGFFLSSASVYFRDIPQILSTFFFVWFWVTPIVYTMNLIPENYQWLEYLNPAYYMVEIYRAALFYGEAPEIKLVVPFFLLSLILFLLSFHIFQKTKRGFSELL
jgi:ABC-type polysaccharide/polyol phosphate export permease